MSNLVKFNPNVRNLYKNILQKNIVDNPQDNLDYLPVRYGSPLIGSGRFRNNALSSQNPHYPSIEAVENSNFGGAYGRSDHNMRVGSGRKAPRDGIAIMKNRVRPALVHEMDMNYMPTSTAESVHGGARHPRLTNAIKQKILEMHPELHEFHLAGGKIDWKKVWNGIKSTAGVVGKIASNPITKVFIPEEYHDTLDKTGQVANGISGMGRRRVCRGGNAKQFFKDFGHGFKIGVKGATNVASKILPIAAAFQPELIPLAGATIAANKAMGGRRRIARKPHLVKGSAEAKAYMARLRSMRKH